MSVYNAESQHCKSRSTLRNVSDSSSIIYDVNYYNINHHILLKSDLKEEDINKVIKKIWKNSGLSEIEKYDEKKDYCYYISKHYNKMKENEFELILDLI